MLAGCVYAQTQTEFHFTGSSQVYEIPDDVTGILIEAWGAQGGGSEGSNIANQDDGGLGGYAKGIKMIGTGQILYIDVGGKPVLISGSGNVGGYNGGGDAGRYGGGGGGASDVKLNLAGIYETLIVAGGGGGGITGGLDYGTGGAGGGLTGADGISLLNNNVPTGGTQSAGGMGAGGFATSGTFGNGGSFLIIQRSSRVAGGGGGYYGGGGGFEVGGAGGSSYLGGVTSGSTETGIRSSNGMVRITELFTNGGGSIISGNARYLENDAIGLNFTVDGENVLFRDIWYYRINGDSREFSFPKPDFTTEFIDNKATLTWLDVGERGLFSAQLIQTINQPNTAAATLSNTFRITSLTNQAMQFDLFHYVDFDIVTQSNDEATLLSGIDHISVIDPVTPNDTNTAEMRAGGNLAFQVTDQAEEGLNEWLNDETITALDNSGLPFVSGDFSGAFQWSEFIPANASLFIEDSFSAGAATAPEPALPRVLLDLIFNHGFEN